METNALLSAIAGSGFASAVAWFFIKKALSNLDQISEKITQIEIKLSAINVKLEHSEKSDSILHEHEKKIAVMENEFYVRQRNAPSACKSQSAAQPT